MNMNRRRFLAATATTAAALTQGCGSPAAAPARTASSGPWTIENVRAEFPRAVAQVYLDAAAHIPLSRIAEAGAQRYMDFHMHGPGEGRGEYAREAIQGARTLFAEMINAKPSEIAFVSSTKHGENIVLNGLKVQERGGNVVTNDLHYAGSVHHYIGRQKAGMDVRIVKHKNWMIDLNDMKKAIDKKTKFVAITLVSNVNGWVEDAKSICEIAHANGAYVYADIIQAVASVPVDVKALGLDFAACSNYKWLAGVRGAAYLYVREELQGNVVQDVDFPGYVRYNYEPWVSAADPGKGAFPYEPPKNASRYEPGNVNYIGYAAQYESLKMFKDLGIDRIWAHSKTLCDRLKKELPGLGYTMITPPDAQSALVVVQAKDLKASMAKLKQANIQVTEAGENRIRISPAFYNNMSDIDKLLAAMA
ncbi:MAG: aminotransferase class V-fold PLP-dependent enzyme [Bryobacterales bacterium]|nr:aminotransferase class V-fold PLP-dependent enzyme [Bryobacterales bacterium]